MSTDVNPSVQAGAREAGASFGSALSRSWRVLYSPSTAMSGLKFRDVLIAATAIIVLYTVASSIALPYAMRALAGGGSPNVLAGSALASIIGIQAAITSTTLAVKWLIFGYAVWAFGTSQGASAPFSRALGVVVLAEVPRVLKEFFKLGLVALRGEPVNTIADLSPPIGLNLWFSDLAPTAGAFLDQFNLFEIWFVVLLAIGMRSALRTPPKTSAALAIAIWALSLVVQLAFGYAARVRLT